MKLKLHLPPPGRPLGLGFDGSCPVVVRKVVDSSPYAHLVQAHKMVVTGVTIIARVAALQEQQQQQEKEEAASSNNDGTSSTTRTIVVDIHGLDMDAAFLIALLKQYGGGGSNSPSSNAEHDNDATTTYDRILYLEERPFCDTTTTTSSTSVSSASTSKSKGGATNNIDVMTIHNDLARAAQQASTAGTTTNEPTTYKVYLSSDIMAAAAAAAAAEAEAQETTNNDDDDDDVVENDETAVVEPTTNETTTSETTTIPAEATTVVVAAAAEEKEESSMLPKGDVSDEKKGDDDDKDNAADAIPTDETAACPPASAPPPPPPSAEQITADDTALSSSSLPPPPPFGLTFTNAPHLQGPARLAKIAETSPVASLVRPGLQLDALEIPGLVTLTHVLNAQKVTELLHKYSDTQQQRRDGIRMILHFSVPRNEVTSAMTTTTTSMNGENNNSSTNNNNNNERYIPLAGASLCKIEGTETQMATVRLCPDQTIHAQPGTLVYMTDGVVVQDGTTTRGLGDSSLSSSLSSSTARLKLREDERIHLAKYTYVHQDPENSATKKKKNSKKNPAVAAAAGTLVLAPTYTGAKIFVVDLEDYGGALIVGNRNFLFSNDDRVMLFSYYIAPTSLPSAAAAATASSDNSHANHAASTASTTTGPNSSPTSSKPTVAALMLRGEGNIRLQRVMGKGKVFLTAGGIVLQKQLLHAHETIRVATSHLVAYQAGMSVTLQGVKGLGNVMVWGEGMAILQGPGTVWIESHPWTRTGLLENR